MTRMTLPPDLANSVIQHHRLINGLQSLQLMKTEEVMRELLLLVKDVQTPPDQVKVVFLELLIKDLEKEKGHIETLDKSLLALLSDHYKNESQQCQSTTANSASTPSTT